MIYYNRSETGEVHLIGATPDAHAYLIDGLRLPQPLPRHARHRGPLRAREVHEGEAAAQPLPREARGGGDGHVEQRVRARGVLVKRGRERRAPRGAAPQQARHLLRGAHGHDGEAGYRDAAVGAEAHVERAREGGGGAAAARARVLRQQVEDRLVVDLGVGALEQDVGGLRGGGKTGRSERV